MAVFMGAAFSPLGAVLCMLTSLILYLVYRLLYAPYHVHKQYGIKGPIPKPFWGSYSDIKKMKMNSFLEEGQKKYGSLFGFYIGSKFNVVVSDIQLVEQILINHDDKLCCGGPYTVWGQLITNSLRAPCGVRLASGHQWQLSRTALTPNFTGLKVRQIIGVAEEGCTTLLLKVADIAETQASTDVHKLYVEFTMKTIIATAFGQTYADTETAGKSSDLISATNEFITAFLDSMSNGAEEITVILSHFPLARPLLVRLAAHLTASQTQRRLQEAGCKLVAARRTHTSPPQDLLQLLLETDLDESKQRFSDQQIVGHAIDFLLSGYETTASVLSHVSYQLALHTNIQDQVQEEIDEYFKTRPKKSLYDASLRLYYLDSVIQETMRIYTPTPIIFRYCEADIELEKHTVPKGADIYIPVFLLHKNPEYWPQPYRFDPTRFSDDEKMKCPQMCHIPFGAGSRNCIGTKFALAEIKMALIAILRRYTFVLTSSTMVPLQSQHSAANIPKNGVPLYILPREAAAP